MENTESTNELAILEEIGEVKDIVTIENGMINFNDYEKTREIVQELAKKYDGMEVTDENYDEARKGRAELKKSRTNLEKVSKHNARICNNIKDQKKKECVDLIAITTPVEDALDEQIKKIEQREKLAKEAADKKEQERVQEITDLQNNYEKLLKESYVAVKLQEASIESHVTLIETLKQDFPKFQEFLFNAEKLYYEYEGQLPELREFIKTKEKEAEELAAFKKREEEAKQRLEEQEEKQRQDREAFEKEKAEFEQQKRKTQEKEDAAEFERRKWEMMEIGFNVGPDHFTSDFFKVGIDIVKAKDNEAFGLFIEELKAMREEHAIKVKKEIEEAAEQKKQKDLADKILQDQIQVIKSEGKEVIDYIDGCFAHLIKETPKKGQDVMAIVDKFYRAVRTEFETLKKDLHQ